MLYVCSLIGVWSCPQWTAIVWNTSNIRLLACRHMPLQAEQAPWLPNPNRHADGEAEQAPRLPNPNCHYDSAAKRAPRSPNPNRHLHGEAERAPQLLNPNCHDDSEAHRAPRLPNPNCHCGGEAPSLLSLSQMRFPASVCPRKQRVFLFQSSTRLSNAPAIPHLFPNRYTAHYP